MDCTMVTSRVAAFLDGALASSECERFVLHIEACTPCSRIVMEIEAQHFSPLTMEQRKEICGREKFWDDMDSVLCAHMDQMVLAKTACLGPWHRRQVGMPLPMVMAYAAAMLMAVAWGVQQRDRALKAEVASEHLALRQRRCRQSLLSSAGVRVWLASLPAHQFARNSAISEYTALKGPLPTARF